MAGHGRLLTGATLLVLALSGCTTDAPTPTITRPAPAPTRSATPTPLVPTRALVDAMFSRLPAAARTAPAFTWDSAGSAGGGTSISGDRGILLAAACDGGGRLLITVGDHDSLVDCTRPSTAGPIDVSAAMPTDPPGAGVEFSVRVASGHPRYVAKAVGLERGER